jgi:N utilization substance protein B
MTEAKVKRTGARRHAREAALQLLFFMEASSQGFAEAAPTFFRNFESDVEGHDYAREAAAGVERRMTEFDDIIRAAAAHWRLERMARVDRTILRLATWELAEQLDVPRAVILDEAVDLAKAYGTAESSSFVNGVLNRIADILKRSDAT